MNDNINIVIDMKKIALDMFRALLVAALVLVAADADAQALRTGYFMDGNVYRHRLNPALQSNINHVSIPVLGGVQVSTMGNVGVGNFLYDSPVNGDELVTFMHSSVDAQSFLSDLESDNVIRMDMDLTLFSMSFNAFGGTNTIDLALRSSTAMSAPYDMFAFMKEMGNRNYSFSDLSMQTRNFADLSLGHSRKINKKLTVGARVKFLFGLGYADMTFDQMDIYTSGSRWEIAARGEANIALGGAYKYSDEKTISGKTVVNGYEDAGVGLRGFGMGIDLGATYDLSEVLLNGLTVSASITDLGFISWGKAATAAISPEDKYVFDGFENLGIHSPEPGKESTTLDDQWSDFRDDLEDFFALEDKGEGGVTTGIGGKFNIGAEYKMPFYKKMSVGFLYTHCFDDVFSYNQASLIANVSPNKCVDLAVSTTFSDYGAGFGAMANLHFTKGVAFFIGTDCFIGKVNKQFIPIEDMNASMSMGVNIAIGARK